MKKQIQILIITIALLALISIGLYLYQKTNFVGIRTFNVSFDRAIEECSEICKSSSNNDCLNEGRDGYYRINNESFSYDEYIVNQEIIKKYPCTFTVSSIAYQADTPKPESSICWITCR